MVFKKKVFKQKIGTKTNADAEEEVKRFTNGHKCFTSAEARAMNEQQHRERKTEIQFELNKGNLMRPRNPMTGEMTPRTGAVYKEIRVDPYPLIQKNRPPAKYPSPPKAVTLKPGQPEPKDGPLTEMELFAREEEKQMCKVDSLRNLQDNVDGELLFLQKKLQDRRKKVNQSLVSNFVNSQTRAFPGSHR
jgi:hypothetical protein